MNTVLRDSGQKTFWITDSRNRDSLEIEEAKKEIKESVKVEDGTKTRGASVGEEHKATEYNQAK